MNKRLFIFWILFCGALLLPTAVIGQVVVEKSNEVVKIGQREFYMHHVKKGETLYSIAKAYQVTEAELLKLNPEVESKGLQADMVLGIPVVPTMAVTTQEVTNTVATDTLKPKSSDGYMVYTVEKSEKTKKLLGRLGVDEEEFRRMNPSVGTRVYEGQNVMIPVAIEIVEEPGQTVPAEQDNNVGEEEQPQETTEETPDTQPVAQEEEPSGPVYSEDMPFDCFADNAHASQEYHVALLVPLYLNDIDKLSVSKEKNDKSKHARPLRFLQFYEGFMMAVDSLTKYHGLRLDLTVIDVCENVSGAEAAVNKLQGLPSLDLIIGPFFSKSFTVVQEFAASNNILIVNPMSEREAILENAPNVIKLKPGMQAMVDELADLIKIKYPKAKVTLFAEDTAKDSLMVSLLTQTLESVVEPEVELSNAEMLDLITRESARRNMGKRVLSTLEVEGQIFSTKALKENPEGIAYFENQFQRLPFSESQTFKNGLSSARDNVLVAYGNNVVYATKILNTINKSTKNYPITLIGLPNWADFDNLLVENLLNMNAIYFDNHFVDYNDSLVLEFVDSFRAKYECEPLDYAFEGFDVGWYFLTSLMHFGPQPMDCLPYYHIPMLHSRYYFNKNRISDGLDNRYWTIYQYDRKSVELKPVFIYAEED